MTYKEALVVNKTAGRRLLEKAAGLTATQLRLADENTFLKPEEEEAFLRMLGQYLNHVPLQYILGSWGFMDLTIKCRPGVLIPRRDTETLAEAAIGFLKNIPDKPTALDLCTGTGCVGIAMAKYCAHVTGTDISGEAVSLARENAQLNWESDRITFIESDLFENVTGRFNCITANPPYIPTDEMRSLPEEVKKEPAFALDGGPDGLNFYRAIIPAAREFLLPGGGLFLEIGASQGKAVTEMLHNHGYRAVVIIKDLEARDRVARGTSTAGYSRIL